MRDKESNCIYALGETIFDIVVDSDESLSGKAGGSVLNATVSLSRLGLRTELLSEIGGDGVGALILDFLNKNKVSTRHSYFFNSGKTPLAMAFLDDKHDASYTFYKQYPQKRFQIKVPEFKTGDALLFGSSFALTPQVRKPLLTVLEKGREQQVTILYDPNYRPSENVSLSEQRSLFLENIKYADIVRGSHDDFSALFGTHNPEDTFKQLCKHSEAILIYTHADSQGVLMDNRRTIYFQPHVCTVRSTIGAGDNFNAGILAGLSRLHFNRQDLNSIKNNSWEIILEIGLTLAALVCASDENYISEEIAHKLFATRGKK